MCGIAGLWHRQGDQAAQQTVLQRMADTLRHRGPDDAGIFVNGGLGLAHRRLAIIDLSPAGRQPMTTPDGRYTIVFNGEIYNYQALKQRYCAGISLRSSSDTEVLLHALAQRGVAVLPELRGMFALALWNQFDQSLLLARDPFGKKPLYHAERGSIFLFASEIKALLATPWVTREVAPDALVKYFLYEYVPAPATGYKDVWQLPMGHWCRVTRSGVQVRRWWQPAFLPKRAVQDEREALARLDGKLALSVRRRMIADVPVGILLSGGLDSATIGWYAKRVAKGPLRTFSVSFPERSFDESAFARLAARTLKTEHHTMTFDLKAWHEALAQVSEQIDIPFGDASLLPTFALSKLARSHITVALDGDGSDELLGGYGTFQAAEVADRLPWLTHAQYARLLGWVRWLPTSYADFSLDFKAKAFVRGLKYPREMRNQVWLGSFQDDELRALLQPAWQKFIGTLWEDVVGARPTIAELSTWDAVSWLTINHYLQNDILVKLDRAAMYVGLEARTPFLDVDLATWLMRLPPTWKRDKYLLKRLMRGRLPDAIIDRRKKGFGIPLGLWLRGPLFAWARSVLASDKLDREGVLVGAEVERLLTEHRAGMADHRKKLWTLLAWQLWYERWIR